MRELFIGKVSRKEYLQVLQQIETLAPNVCWHSGSKPSWFSDGFRLGHYNYLILRDGKLSYDRSSVLRTGAYLSVREFLGLDSSELTALRLAQDYLKECQAKSKAARREYLRISATEQEAERAYNKKRDALLEEFPAAQVVHCTKQYPWEQPSKCHQWDPSLRRF